MKLLAEGIQKLELEFEKQSEIRCRDLDLTHDLANGQVILNIVGVKKSTKIALKVKGQGQMSQTSNHF